MIGGDIYMAISDEYIYYLLYEKVSMFDSSIGYDFRIAIFDRNTFNIHKII